MPTDSPQHLQGVASHLESGAGGEENSWRADLAARPSLFWLVAFVFGVAFLVTVPIYTVVISLSAGERGRAFAAISPGLLPPMGIIFALLVGFLAAQVWSSGERAAAAVSEEASSLRSVVLLSSEFPGQPEARIRGLVRRHIEDAVTKEWPQMAERGATLSVVPQPLADLQALALGLRPDSPGQTIAQQEIVEALEQALDARRQRIIVSESSVNGAKWGAVISLAILTLLAIAFVHSGNRRTAAIAMALFASAASVAILMIAAQAHPLRGTLPLLRRHSSRSSPRCRRSSADLPSGLADLHAALV